MKKRALSFLLVVIMTFTFFPWSALPANAYTWAEYVIETEAKYFDVKPFIDGYVSEEEWGEPTFGVYQDYASVPGDRTPGIENSFFYSDETYDADSLKMGYEIWFRWDEDYFYTAVKASDPDGHSLKNGRFDTWNGDAFQMRIDPAGENGICYGDTFNAAEYAANGYRPWSSASVCDLVFGYVERANGYCEAYDNTDGTTGKGMTEFSNNPMGVVDLAIVPAGYQYSTDSANGITTYEIAVPWAYIDGWYDDYAHEYKENATFEAKDGSAGPDGAIGREYGISTVLYNADGNTEADRYNALLAWGSGISDVQIKEALETCGGSNEVTLVADKVSEDSSYNKNFTKYIEGGYAAPKKTPGYGIDIDQDRYVKLTYDNESDMDMIGWTSNGERVKLDDGNWVVMWDKATGLEMPDENGEYPSLNTSTFISTAGEEGEGSRYPVSDNSFTFEFDIMVTGLEEFDSASEAAVYNLFGGIGGTDYKCGYFFDDGKFRIVDNNTDAIIAESWKSSFTLNEWHHWVFQYDDETCTVRLYIDPFDDAPSYEFGIHDADFAVSSYSSHDAYPVLALSWRYFDYGSTVDPLLIFGRSNAQIMLDNIEMYNFVDYRYASPSTFVTSGTCGLYGDNLTWDIDRSSGVLTISGEGEMDNYYYDTPWDWHSNIIKKIVINEGATTIGNYAFYGCSALEDINIPDSVTSIGEDAFHQCTSIAYISIPDSVTSIGDRAFAYCSSLKNISLPDSVTSLGKYAFFVCYSLENIKIPSGVTRIENSTFFDCSALESVDISGNLASIGTSAFANCEALTDIVLPDTLREIGVCAFNLCESLASINIPSGVMSIGSSAFSGTAIESIKIPEGIMRIEESTFHGCTSLESIIIPKSVTYIEVSAFIRCDNLKTVYYTGTEEEWNNIEIEIYNEPLLNANIIFNYEPEVILGDVNGDNEVNMKDVLAIRQSMVGLVDVDLKLADVNGDGEVNMKDVLMIRQYIAGIIDEFPG